MLTKIILILLLYGCIAGEGGNRNITRLRLKKGGSPEILNNSTGFNSAAKRSNHRRRTHDSKIFRVLVPISEDESDEFKAKGDLQPDKGDGMSPISTINRISSGAVTSHEKHNSSDVLQADETYNLPIYAHGPQRHLPYSPQFSNWDVNRYQRNDPCASYSSPGYNLQAYFGQSSHLQNDPYLSQGTYNVHYYAQVHQQPQHYPIRLQNYNGERRGVGYNREYINPCIPNQPIPPSSGGARHFYPNINPPKHHVQPYRPQNAYDSFLPNIQVHPPSQIYGDVRPPQQVNPKYITPRPTPPKHTPPIWSPNTKSYYTPPPPSPPTCKRCLTPPPPPPPSPPPCRRCHTPPPPPPPPPPTPPPCRRCLTPPPPPPCRRCPTPPPPPPPCRRCHTPPPPPSPPLCRRCPTPPPRYTPPNGRSTPRTKGYNWDGRS